MKYKNIIYIIVDAFCYNNLNIKVGSKSVTPFLNKLISKSTTFTELYSQAPYTEASQVTLLSGENTLDSGGYLFGNKTIKTPMFENYQQHGYKTLFSYSPYVYSKGYLRNVDKYYYTRLFSIEPLFLYRLSYYKDKLTKENKLYENDYQICLSLLEEALDTWILQCRQFTMQAGEIQLIKDKISENVNIKNILEELEAERLEFNDDRKKYLHDIFSNYKTHKLLQINKEFNRYKPLKYKDDLINLYSKNLNNYQQIFSKIAKRQHVDLNYVFGMLFNDFNNNGLRKCKDLVHAYLNYYNGTTLSSYLENITEDSKVEVSITKLFDTYKQDILNYDAHNQNYFAYIHAQDFHLPSVFHTYDSNNLQQISDEFDAAFKLLAQLDNNFRGNIIAALSARFCDLKIEHFFNYLSENLKNEFLFVVTADHGFPLYENPPRPFIYNQTYTEAFHIPAIIYDSEHRENNTINNLTSNMDIVNIMQDLSFTTNPASKISFLKRDYILCEYGGPGCPVINEKPIWYTLIDNNFCISAECRLNDKFQYACIKEIYNLKADPAQKKNLVKKYRNKNFINYYLRLFKERHAVLQKKHAGEKFYKNMLNNSDNFQS